jgi:hypothetical protein
MKSLRWVVAALAVGLSSCGSADRVESGWAIVKVEILDGPALASICIDTDCRDFDPGADVRTGEFSAYTATGTVFEVRRVGESIGEGASGGAPVGGCMLVVLETDSGSFVGGCNVPPDGN